MDTFLAIAIGIPAAVLLAVAVPFILRLAYDRMEFALVVVLAMYFMEVVFVEFPGFKLGIFLYPGDIVFGLLALVALARLVFAKEVPGRSILWLLFGVAIFISFLLGISQFGRTAGTEFRTYFYIWVAGLYFWTFTYDEARIKRIVDGWLICSFLLVVLACFRWAAELMSLPIALSWRGTGDVAEYRVLPSGATLFLAQTFMILAYRSTIRSASKLTWLAVLALLAMVLFMQHRSVWIAALTGIAGFYILMPGPVRIMLTKAAVIGAVLVGVPAIGLVAYGMLDKLVYSVQTSVATGADLERGTAGGRIYGWNQLLLQMRPTDYILGKPFGAGYERYEVPNARWKATYDPHNFYLQTLLRAGLIGLFLWLAIYFVTMKRTLGKRVDGASGDLPPRLLCVMLITQLAYTVAYRLSYEQAILLGLAISIGMVARRSRTDPARSTVARFDRDGVPLAAREGVLRAQ